MISVWRPYFTGCEVMFQGFFAFKRLAVREWFAPRQIERVLGRKDPVKCKEQIQDVVWDV